MLTGSMVLIWTLGAEEERSLWPNWLRWSSSPGLKDCGIGMDLDGDTVGWHRDLEKTETGEYNVILHNTWLKATYTLQYILNVTLTVSN